MGLFFYFILPMLIIFAECGCMKADEDQGVWWFGIGGMEIRWGSGGCMCSGLFLMWVT